MGEARSQAQPISPGLAGTGHICTARLRPSRWTTIALADVGRRCGSRPGRLGPWLSSRRGASGGGCTSVGAAKRPRASISGRNVRKLSAKSGKRGGLRGGCKGPKALQMMGSADDGRHGLHAGGHGFESRWLHSRNAVYRRCSISWCMDVGLRVKAGKGRALVIAGSWSRRWRSDQRRLQGSSCASNPRGRCSEVRRSASRFSLL